MGNNDKRFDDDERLVAIPSNVMGGTVAVTRGESEPVQGAGADGLDLAGDMYVET